MQVTITLNHLLILLFLGLFGGVALYALLIYKKINRELSVAGKKISLYRERLSHIEEQLKSITASVEYVKAEAGKDRAGRSEDPCTMNLLNSLAMFKEALRIVRGGHPSRRKRNTFRNTLSWLKRFLSQKSRQSFFS
jgi:hypothetical protein